MKCPVIVLGGGGHAKVLIDVLQVQAIEILGFTDVAGTKSPVLDVAIIGNDDAVLRYAPKKIRLVNGLGSVRVSSLRKQLYEDFKKKGYCFAVVVHPSSVVASSVVLAEGVQVMAGAVIQPESHVGENTIVNTGAIVDHDCRIGAHVHIAPGVTISGGVVVEDGVHIGTGATIIQGIHLGRDCLIGAGAVVVKDVKEKTTVMGVPAGEIMR